MGFIIFLVALLIFLIAISIVNLFLSVAIKLVTNNSIEEYKFIIPSILFIIITGLSFLLIYLLTINILELNIMDSVMAIVFKTVDIAPKIKTILIIDVIIVVVAVLIQSLCLMTVNIDYTITCGKIRMFFKDIIKKIKVLFKKKNKEKSNIASEEVSNNKINDATIVINTTEINDEIDAELSNLAAVIPEGEMAENKEIKRLTIGNSIICSIFVFSFLFFTFMALFTLGGIIANEVLFM